MTAAAVGGPRHEVRAALWLVLAVLVVSVLAGLVWALLAPTEKIAVVSPGLGAALVGESAHRFDSLAIFVCIAAVTGLLTGVGAWRVRRWRGPILQLGLLLGSLVGAALMVWSGEHIASALHPHVSDPAVHSILRAAPTVDAGGLFGIGDTRWPRHSWLHAGAALAVQPLVASLVTLVLSALSTTEDLGTGLDRIDTPTPGTVASGTAVPPPLPSGPGR